MEVPNSTLFTLLASFKALDEAKISYILGGLSSLSTILVRRGMLELYVLAVSFPGLPFDLNSGSKQKKEDDSALKPPTKLQSDFQHIQHI